MSEAGPAEQKSQDSPPPAACARCERALGPGDRVEAGGRTFCRSCYETLRMELQRGAAALSQDVNYPMAAIGAVLGGALGVLLWWGFTVLTKISFGLAAVAIGFLVGHGATRFAGHKRTAGLQALSVIVATLCFAVATYLVNMTFINAEMARRGEVFRVPFPPTSPDLAFRVVSLSFGIMDVVFLAIVVWEAWRIPRPVKLAPVA
jgi:hypothetical protein